MHLPRRPPRIPQPAIVTVERRHAVPVRRVRERYPLVRILRVNVDRHVPVAKCDRALHHPARSLADRSGSPCSLQILVDQLIAIRRACLLRLCAFTFLFFHLLGLGHGWHRLFSHHRRYPNWLTASSVTGIACNFATSLEVILINGEHHRHHFPRRLFRLLVVLLARALHVAKLTFHAQ